MLLDRINGINRDLMKKSLQRPMWRVPGEENKLAYFTPLETLHIGPDALASVPLPECEGPLSDLRAIHSFC